MNVIEQKRQEIMVDLEMLRMEAYSVLWLSRITWSGALDCFVQLLGLASEYSWVVSW